MAEFARAIPVILAHEGGFVDDPRDPGGATNWGISSRFLRDAGLPDDVRTMTRARACQIYAVHFWRPTWAKLRSQTLATKLLDVCVNVGHPQMTVLLQKALCYVGDRVAVDGVWGPRTWGAVLRADANAPGNLVREICAAQADFYKALVARKPQLAKFLPGWLKRAAWCG